MKIHSLYAATAYLTAYKIAASEGRDMATCCKRGEACANAFRANEIKRGPVVETIEWGGRVGREYVLSFNG